MRIRCWLHFVRWIFTFWLCKSNYIQRFNWEFFEHFFSFSLWTCTWNSHRVVPPRPTDNKNFTPFNGLMQKNSQTTMKNCFRLFYLVLFGFISSKMISRNMFFFFLLVQSIYFPLSLLLTTNLFVIYNVVDLMCNFPVIRRAIWLQKCYINPFVLFYHLHWNYYCNIYKIQMLQCTYVIYPSVYEHRALFA